MAEGGDPLPGVDWGRFSEIDPGRSEGGPGHLQGLVGIQKCLGGATMLLGQPLPFTLVVTAVGDYLVDGGGQPVEFHHTRLLLVGNSRVGVLGIVIGELLVRNGGAQHLTLILIKHIGRAFMALRAMSGVSLHAEHVTRTISRETVPSGIVEPAVGVRFFPKTADKGRPGASTMLS